MRILTIALLIFSLFVVVVSALSISEHKTEYREYVKSHTTQEVIVDEPLRCSYNDTVKRETCNKPTSHVEYVITDTVYVPVEKSRVELILIDGVYKEVPNSYSKDGMFSIWTVDVGDRNFKEFPTCRKYEVDKGFCGVTPLQ